MFPPTGKRATGNGRKMESISAPFLPLFSRGKQLFPVFLSKLELGDRATISRFREEIQATRTGKESYRTARKEGFRSNDRSVERPRRDRELRFFSPPRFPHRRVARLSILFEKNATRYRRAIVRAIPETLDALGFRIFRLRSTTYLYRNLASFDPERKRCVRELRRAPR